MSRFLLSAALLCVPTASGFAKLEIQNVQAVHGDLGPIRKSLDLYPEDELVLRFTVAGAKPNAEGRVSASITLHVTDSAGKDLVKQTGNLQVHLTLGGDSFPWVARLNIGPKVTPGEFLLNVTIKDNGSSETAEFERKVTLKDTEYAIVTPRFFHDGEAKIPAAPRGVVGEHLHFRMKVIGFDRVTGQIDAALTMQVLDGAGKDVLPKPLGGNIRNEDAEAVKKISSLTFNGSFLLNRPGDYTIRFQVTDKIAKKTTAFETPLHVEALSVEMKK